MSPTLDHLPAANTDHDRPAHLASTVEHSPTTVVSPQMPERHQTIHSLGSPLISAPAEIEKSDDAAPPTQFARTQLRASSLSQEDALIDRQSPRTGEDEIMHMDDTAIEDNTAVQDDRRRRRAQDDDEPGQAVSRTLPPSHPLHNPAAAVRANNADSQTARQAAASQDDKPHMITPAQSTGSSAGDAAAADCSTTRHTSSHNPSHPAEPDLLPTFPPEMPLISGLNDLRASSSTKVRARRTQER